MKLRFTKMHGLGNDFVMIDAISQQVKLNEERVRFIADRRFGVGCDQVLVVEAPDSPEVDFRYRIYNQDGNEVEQCGNGARCFALFVRMRRLTGKKNIRVQTLSGNVTLNVLDNDWVEVDMGSPEFAPTNIPFSTEKIADTYSLDVDGQIFEISAVSMGNPHSVAKVEDVKRFPVGCVGKKIESHPLFPKRVNAGFMEIVSSNEINLRVYERGVGETLACGTGACAAAVSAIKRKLVKSPVKVNLPGGSTHITWSGGQNSVLMTGPAKTVFHGQIKI